MILNLFEISNTEKGRSCCKTFFSQRNHTKENLKVVGIEKVLGTEIYRKVNESFWMKKINTLESEGLDTQYERK